jgi:hypothetical protein
VPRAFAVGKDLFWIRSVGKDLLWASVVGKDLFLIRSPLRICPGLLWLVRICSGSAWLVRICLGLLIDQSVIVDMVRTQWFGGIGGNLLYSLEID